jgi:ATP-dependent Lhr-like helicase
MQGRDEVGYIQARFVQGHDEQKGPLCFRLGGRAWQVTHIDWPKSTMSVRPADAGQVPNWLGPPGVLSYDVCQAMREVLMRTDTPGIVLTPPAASELKSLRQSYAELLELAPAPVESTADSVQWHTFAGGGINRLLAAGLEHLTGKRWVSGNLTLRCKEAGLAETNEALAQLSGLSWEPLAFAKARSMARGVISKFQPCLPVEAEDRLLAEKLLDLGGTLRFVAQMRYAAREAAAALGRLLDGAVDVVPELSPELVLPPVAGAFQPRNPITWIDTPAGLARLCEALATESVVALDVETALDFSTLCLVQFGTRTRTWVVDALRVPDLSPLRPILANPTVIKVIHNARFERRVFAKEGLDIVSVFDTLDAARQRHTRDMLGGHSLGAVVARELGLHLDKRQQLSNWAQRPLAPEQIAYAAADVEVLIALEARMRGVAGQLGVWGPGDNDG